MFDIGFLFLHLRFQDKNVKNVKLTDAGEVSVIFI